MQCEAWRNEPWIRGITIIAVAAGGAASLVVMLTGENWKIEAQCDFDSINE